MLSGKLFRECRGINATIKKKTYLIYYLAGTIWRMHLEKKFFELKDEGIVYVNKLIENIEAKFVCKTS